MNNIIKKILFVFIGLIIVFVITVVAVTHFLPPEKIKDPVLTQLNARTGLIWEISGPITWSFFPKIGLDIHDLSISEPATPSNHLIGRVAEAKITVHLLSLFRGAVATNEIVLLGAEPALKANFQMTSDNNKQTLDAVISQFELQKWLQQTGIVAITQPLPENLTAKVHAVMAKDNVSVVFQTLTLDSSNIHGEAKFWPKNKKLSFSADANILDLDRYNSTAKSANAKGGATKTASGGKQRSNHDKASTQLFSSDLLQAVRQYAVDGEIKIGQLKKAGLSLEDADLKVHLQNGVLQLQPMSASAYSGQLQGNVRLDLSSDTPNWQLAGNIAHFQVKPFLKDLYHYEKVTGEVEGDIKVQTRGNQEDVVLRGLNGTAAFKVVNGQLQGIDLGYWLGAAKAILDKKLPSGGKNTGATEFAQLTSTFNINNGIAVTKDFKLYNRLMSVAGEGKIDLARRYIDFHLNISETGSRNGMQFPILVQGEFGNTHVQVDPAFIKQMLEKAVTSNLLKKLGGGAAGAVAPTGAGGLLQKGLGKFLGN